MGVNKPQHYTTGGAGDGSGISEEALHRDRTHTYEKAAF